MIIINVTLPMLDREYDFQIDEDTPMHEISREILEMVSRNEQCPLVEETDRVVLWERQTSRMIRPNQTAVENGLVTGSRLLLT